MFANEVVAASAVIEHYNIGRQIMLSKRRAEQFGLLLQGYRVYNERLYTSSLLSHAYDTPTVGSYQGRYYKA